MEDSVQIINSVDIKKAFEALARVIGDKEGVEVRLKSLKKNEKEDK